MDGKVHDKSGIQEVEYNYLFVLLKSCNKDCQQSKQDFKKCVGQYQSQEIISVQTLLGGSQNKSPPFFIICCQKCSTNCHIIDNYIWGHLKTLEPDSVYV